jgi:hypothetical protein
MSFVDEGTTIAEDEGAAADEPQAVPDCTMVKQEQTYWCWAAVTQTIEGVRHNNLEQCDIAQKVIGTDCCADKGSCNKEKTLPEVLEACAISFTPQGGMAGFPAIKEQIDAGNPVACMIRFNTASINHLILISGYLPGEQLQLLDPADENPISPTEQSYQSFRLLYRDDGSWKNTYFLT